MATHFTVECPRCRKGFPVHTELWQAGYDLLCPFCANTFAQETSPHIVTATGEVRRSEAGAQPDAIAQPDTSAVESM